MKILITGSNGFIGKHMVSSLIRDKNISLVVSSRKHLKSLEGKAKQFISPSIDSSTNWSEALEGVDVVIHLIGVTHNNDRKDSESNYYETNVNSSITLATQAAESGVKRFIYLSSIKVNGEVTKEDKTFHAGDLPNPLDIYGKTKLGAESSLRKVAQKSGLELVIIRPTLVYGPGVRGNFLQLMKLIKLRVPLPFASLTNKRSILSINNLVDFIRVCVKHPSAKDEVFLVSDSKPISVKDLIKDLSKLQKRHILFFPFPRFFLSLIFNLIRKKEYSLKLLGSLEVNIQKNQELLGWLPPQSTDEGLKEATRNFLENE